MRANPEQHFVLDDVADSGKYVLFQQSVTDERFRHGLELAPGQSGVPRVRHHVRPPIIFLIERPLDVPNGAAVEVQLAAARKLQGKTRLAILSLVDAVTAEHEEVNSDGKAVQLDEKVLAPRSQRNDALADQPRLINLRIAFRRADTLASEWLRELAEDDE